MSHNLDVMHIEKNVCDNIVGILMDIEKEIDGYWKRKKIQMRCVKKTKTLT